MANGTLKVSNIETSSGSGTITISQSGETVTLTGNTTISGTSTLTGGVTGDLKFNSGYGSVVTAYGVRAWTQFNGTGTPAIRASGNVSSITDVSTGRYKVNFTTNMPDVNYSVAIASAQANNNDSQVHNVEAPNVAYVEFQRRENGTVYDSSYIFVTVTR